uniref:Uncharacterized mitochondrial protein AtMg00810-like n=1 Tax=Nicotiana tabacum TaxID=4097 RepID=A0A1S4CSR6_TOBAC|nr:PREDICTED: uncharacterized mitochondrial protein AtMg00810-like [Nicotiana tabacum]
MLLAGDNLKLVQDTKAALQQTFKMKDLGELKYFFGIEFARSKQGILMHQRKYSLELISELGLAASKPINTLIDTSIKLTTREFDEHFSKTNLAEDELLAYQAKKTHMEAALRIVRYIKSQPGQGILLSSNNNETVTAFCDADWVACPHTRKSITWYLIEVGDSLVSWNSKKQSIISRSSAEVEYRSLASTVAELTWLLGLMKEIDVKIDQPVTIFCDNKVAIQMPANPVYHERTKHIEIDCHFIREKIQQGMVKTEYIPTKEQPADMFTKGLNRVCNISI